MICIQASHDRTREELLVDGKLILSRPLDRGINVSPVTTEEVVMDTIKSPFRAPGETRAPEFRDAENLGWCTHCKRGVWLVDQIKTSSTYDGNTHQIGRCQGCRDTQEMPFAG